MKNRGILHGSVIVMHKLTALQRKCYFTMDNNDITIKCEVSHTDTSHTLCTTALYKLVNLQNFPLAFLPFASYRVTDKALIAKNCAMTLLCHFDLILFFKNSMFGFIRITCSCNVYPLSSHFYIVKMGFTGVYIISYFRSKTYIVGTR